MPWNDQGDKEGGKKGPWGTPPRGDANQKPNPWGKPEAGNGSGRGDKERNSGSGIPEPPDLDVLFGIGLDKLRHLFSSGPGGEGKGGIILVVAGLLCLAVLALSSCYTVAPAETAVVLRLGQFNRLANPGLRFRLPLPFESVTLVKTGMENTLSVTNTPPASTSRRGEVPDTEDNRMLTGDENVVNMDFVVKWKVSDPKDYVFNMRDPDETIRRVGESAMREIIGRTPVQTVLTGSRPQIEADTRIMMQKILASYNAGVLIADVQILKVNPPSEVVDAFNEVQAALQDKERLSNEADAYVNRIMPEAHGDAQRLRADAEGYRDQVVDLATGNAQRFLAVEKAHALAPGLTDYRLYLETMEKVLNGTPKTIIGAGSGVVPYLPLSELPRPPATARDAKAGAGANASVNEGVAK